MQETLIRNLAAVRAAAQPTLASRCDKAVALVLTGKVHVVDAAHALVDSYREPGVQYTVNATCSCQDAKHGAPEGWCAHRLAVDFVRACPPATAPPACPEAAFSLCLKGRLAGQDAQLTIRAQTAEAFKANVGAVRGLLDAPSNALAPTSGAATFQPQLDGLAVELDQLTQRVKEAVLAHGASVKGTGLHAVYSPGRVSWDEKFLQGYAATHEEILQARIEGKASVSLRKVR